MVEMKKTLITRIFVILLAVIMLLGTVLYSLSGVLA